jgi:hypothetical protein
MKAELTELRKMPDREDRRGLTFADARLVFQHRRPARDASDRHVRELADAVKAHGTLAPVTVWWDGKHWSCIDGHHRHQAYMAGHRSDVPVEVFEGTPEEAVARAAGARGDQRVVRRRRGEAGRADGGGDAEGLGATAERQPDIFMRAVQMYSERLARSYRSSTWGLYGVPRGARRVTLLCTPTGVHVHREGVRGPL